MPVSQRFHSRRGPRRYLLMPHLLSRSALAYLLLSVEITRLIAMKNTMDIRRSPDSRFGRTAAAARVLSHVSLRCRAHPPGVRSGASRGEARGPCRPCRPRSRTHLRTRFGAAILGWRMPVSLRFRAGAAVAISFWRLPVIASYLILLAIVVASCCSLSLTFSYVGPRHLDLPVAIC